MPSLHLKMADLLVEEAWNLSFELNSRFFHSAESRWSSSILNQNFGWTFTQSKSLTKTFYCFVRLRLKQSEFQAVWASNSLRPKQFEAQTFKAQIKHHSLCCSMKRQISDDIQTLFCNKTFSLVSSSLLKRTVNYSL